MALADEKGSKSGLNGNSFNGAGTYSSAGMILESFEARQLLAFNPVGAVGTLTPTTIGQTVESAAAAPNIINGYRYATVVGPNGTTLNVVPVTGPDSSTPGTPINVALPANGVVSNTDVAANTSSDLVVVTYQVTVTTPPGPGIPGGTDSDIYEAVFANGTIVGAPTRVNTVTNGNQSNSRVAMDSAGNFIVVWESSIPGSGLVGRRFNAGGAANGGEFAIASVGVEPDVAANAAGAFLIGYSVPSGATPGTFVQLYNANGTVSGTPVTVSSDIFSEPAVGIANNGRFLVAWETTVGGTLRIVGQRYNANESLLGGTFNAATVVSQSQIAPEVAFDTTGGFAIGWAQATTGLAYDQVAFRVFNGNTGAGVAAETVITGVQLNADHRFGLAYRVAGTIHIAYATPAGEALMQTYVNSAGSGGGDIPVPSGALLIDETAQTADTTIIVDQSGNTITVYTNGVGANFTASNFSSIYIRGSAFNDYLKITENVSLPAIIYGRAGADTIYGGEGNDQIDGGDGGNIPDDGTTVVTRNAGNVIQARGGNDYIYGGSSDDTLFGGAGADRILGGPGQNLIYGEDDNDTLIGGNRGDGIFGAAGDDSLDGGDGGDYLDGGAGADTLTGGTGNDRLNGSNGVDSLEGGDGDDILHGGRGDDRLFGNDGRDTLFGDANADFIRTGGNNGRFGNILLDIVYYDVSDTVS
ncbi:MAG: type secretion target repeat protein, partial [Phycisphaerales bacterium]|nr:type secretion target repeat protein [Phycisphaerales bacterium]